MMGGANLGGGGNLAAIKNALQTASVGGRRNDIPLGTGWYLLKTGQYEFKERSSTQITTFDMICLRAIKDGNGVAPGAAGYVGPIVGENYDTALFQSGDYAMKNNLAAIAACMGWSQERIKEMQSDQNIMELISIVDQFTGLVSETQQPTGQPCIFSNQVVIEMTSSVSSSFEKVNGVEIVDAVTHQKIPKSYTNVYWNGKISIADVNASVPEDVILKAFGTQEAFLAAHQMEQRLNGA